MYLLFQKMPTTRRRLLHRRRRDRVKWDHLRGTPRGATVPEDSLGFTAATAVLLLLLLLLLLLHTTGLEGHF